MIWIGTECIPVRSDRLKWRLVFAVGRRTTTLGFNECKNTSKGKVTKIKILT